MKRFDLSSRQAKELARGNTLLIALPLQPGHHGMESQAYARRVLPSVRHDDIRRSQWGEVWVSQQVNTGAVGELLGHIVEPDAAGDGRYLVVSIVVCLVTLHGERRGSVYPVAWPGVILDE